MSATSRTIKPWTVTEIERLRKSWPVKSKAELMKEFPGRSHASLMGMAKAMRFRRLCKRRDWPKIIAEHKPAFNFMTGAIR